MKTNFFYISLAVAVASAGLTFTGCETTSHPTGLAGFVSHDIVATKTMDAEATVSAHKYTPAEGQILSLEGESVTPAAAAPGNAIKGTLNYALLGTGSEGIDVTETRQLMRGNELVDETRDTVHRTDGTWKSTQEFDLPANAPLGEYTLVQRVLTARDNIAAASSFFVRETVAQLTTPGMEPQPLYTAPPAKPYRSSSDRYLPGYGPGPGY